MHFSLRTLLVVITAVAVYVGFHLGMIRTFHGDFPMNAPGFFGMLYRLPLFTIWSVAAASIYPRRKRLPSGNLVLGAILLAFVWLLASPFAQLIFLRLGGPSTGNMNFMRWYSAAYVVVEGAVEAISWGLILYAYVKASALATAELPSLPPSSSNAS